MNDKDFDAFALEFSRLSAALERYKVTSEELRQKADVYFHALKRFPLTDVIAKADTWLATESRMPKPAEWAHVIPKAAGVALEALSPTAASEWQAAELAGWEGKPCPCHECVDAGVTEKPIRFVPEQDRDGHDRLVVCGTRTVTAGRWIHGWELFRWYDARGNFWAAMYARFGTFGTEDTRRKQEPFAKRLDALIDVAHKVLS